MRQNDSNVHLRGDSSSLAVVLDLLFHGLNIDTTRRYNNKSRVVTGPQKYGGPTVHRDMVITRYTDSINEHVQEGRHIIFLVPNNAQFLDPPLSPLLSSHFGFVSSLGAHHHQKYRITPAYIERKNV